MVGLADQSAALESLFAGRDDDDVEYAVQEPDDTETVAEEEDDEFLGLAGLAAPFVAPVVGDVVRQGAAAVGRLFSPRRPRPVSVRPPMNRGQAVRGNDSATVLTPGGPVRLQFPQPYVTAPQLRAALEGVRRDIAAVRDALRVSDERHAKAVENVAKTTATAIAADAAKTRDDIKKLEKRLDKKIDDTKQLMMLMTFLGDSEDGSDDGDDLLPLFLMMGSGGLGGGSNDAMMLLALTGKL
jgi:hypothetical protein